MRYRLSKSFWYGMKTLTLLVPVLGLLFISVSFAQSKNQQSPLFRGVITVAEGGVVRDRESGLQLTVLPSSVQRRTVVSLRKMAHLEDRDVQLDLSPLFDFEAIEAYGIGPVRTSFLRPAEFIIPVEQGLLPEGSLVPILKYHRRERVWQVATDAAGQPLLGMSIQQGRLVKFAISQLGHYALLHYQALTKLSQPSAVMLAQLLGISENLAQCLYEPNCDLINAEACNQQQDCESNDVCLASECLTGIGCFDTIRDHVDCRQQREPDQPPPVVEVHRADPDLLDIDLHPDLSLLGKITIDREQPSFFIEGLIPKCPDCVYLLAQSVFVEEIEQSFLTIVGFPELRGHQLFVEQLEQNVKIKPEQDIYLFSLPSDYGLVSGTLFDENDQPDAHRLLFSFDSQANSILNHNFIATTTNAGHFSSLPALSTGQTEGLLIGLELTQGLSCNLIGAIKRPTTIQIPYPLPQSSTRTRIDIRRKRKKPDPCALIVHPPGANFNSITNFNDHLENLQSPFDIRSFADIKRCFETAKEVVDAVIGLQNTIQKFLKFNFNFEGYHDRCSGEEYNRGFGVKKITVGFKGARLEDVPYNDLNFDRLIPSPLIKGFKNYDPVLIANSDEDGMSVIPKKPYIDFNIAVRPQPRQNENEPVCKPTALIGSVYARVDGFSKEQPDKDRRSQCANSPMELEGSFAGSNSSFKIVGKMKKFKGPTVTRFPDFAVMDRLRFLRPEATGSYHLKLVSLLPDDSEVPVKSPSLSFNVIECCTSSQDCRTPNLCDKEICNQDTGRCEHPPKCDSDDLICTDDCDGETGACSYKQRECITDDICKTAECSEEKKGCHYPDRDCSDNDLCTNDYCHPRLGCQNDPLDCSNDNPCTIDSCDPQTGDCRHDPKCNDGLQCTRDECHIVTGACSHPPARDGLRCETGLNDIGQCESGVCVADPTFIISLCEQNSSLPECQQDIHPLIGVPQQPSLVRGEIPISLKAEIGSHYRIEIYNPDNNKSFECQGTLTKAFDPSFYQNLINADQTLPGNACLWDTGLNAYSYGDKYNATTKGRLGKHIIKVSTTSPSGHQQTDQMEVIVSNVIPFVYGGKVESTDNQIGLEFLEHSIQQPFQLVSIEPLSPQTYRVLTQQTQFIRSAKLTLALSQPGFVYLATDIHNPQTWQKLAGTYDNHVFTSYLTGLPQKQSFLVVSTDHLNKPLSIYSHKTRPPSKIKNAAISRASDCLTNKCLKITNPDKGHFKASLIHQKIDLNQNPVLSFYYQMDPGVEVNLQAKVNGTWFEMILNDEPKDYQRINMHSIGNLQITTRENNWYEASIHLKEKIQQRSPHLKNPLVLEELTLANFDSQGYMRLWPASYPKGLSVKIDKLQLSPKKWNWARLKQSFRTKIKRLTATLADLAPSFSKLPQPEPLLIGNFKEGKTVWGDTPRLFHTAQAHIQAKTTSRGQRISFSNIHSQRYLETWAGWAIDLPNIDVRGYRFLELRLKKITGFEKPNLYIRDAQNTAILALDHYLKPNQQWQTIQIPLSQLRHHSLNLKKLTELVLAFEWDEMDGEMMVGEISFKGGQRLSYRRQP